MPVCDPGSLPGFVGTVTTVAGRGSPADLAILRSPFRDPLPRQLAASQASPGARSVLELLLLARPSAGASDYPNPGSPLPDPSVPAPASPRPRPQKTATFVVLWSVSIAGRSIRTKERRISRSSRSWRLGRSVGRRGQIGRSGGGSVQVAGDGVGQGGGHRLGRGLVGGLDHHPDQRLGAGGPDEDPTLVA
jgi:hypothetical protein